MDDEPRVSDTVLTVHEVALRFGVADKTVRRWLAEGSLKGIRFGRWGQWRIPAAEVERVMGR
jgi:excisionase family DNA binding protein